MDIRFYDRLEVLRKFEKLSPIGYAMVLYERKKQDKQKKLYDDYYGLDDFVDAECDDAEKLEYFLRFQKFATEVEPAWHQNNLIEHDGLSLKEFAEMILDGYVAQKTKTRRK